MQKSAPALGGVLQQTPPFNLRAARFLAARTPRAASQVMEHTEQVNHRSPLDRWPAGDGPPPEQAPPSPIARLTSPLELQWTGWSIPHFDQDGEAPKRRWVPRPPRSRPAHARWLMSPAGGRATPLVAALGRTCSIIVHTCASNILSESVDGNLALRRRLLNAESLAVLGSTWA
jgi:hypothetical protein